MTEAFRNARFNTFKSFYTNTDLTMDNSLFGCDLFEISRANQWRFPRYCKELLRIQLLSDFTSEEVNVILHTVQFNYFLTKYFDENQENNILEDVRSAIENFDVPSYNIQERIRDVKRRFSNLITDYDRLLVKDETGSLIEIENEGFLQLGDRPLFCAESQPSLTYQNQLISVLHFTKISFVRETSVRIGPSRILYWYDHRSIVLEGATPKIIQLPEGQDVVLNIVNPIPWPLNDDLNVSLTHDDSDCFIHLFFVDDNGFTFVSSFSSPWKDLYTKICSELSEKNRLPMLNIKVGIVTEPEIIPTLETGATFFTSTRSYLNGKRIMTMAVTSNSELVLTIGNESFSTSNLAALPKCISRLAALKLRDSRTNVMAKYWRRLVTIAIDGGIAVDLFEFCHLEMGDTVIRPEHFERVTLYLENYIERFDDLGIVSELNNPLYNMRNFIKRNSNEQTLCSLFWNMAMSILFQGGELRNQFPRHRLELEWNTTNLYPNVSPRRVDFVSLIDLNQDAPIPILSVESGKSPFSRDSQHKDFSMLLGIISANCITLAFQLYQSGKKPELARAYGMLIGGSTVQLCVAHPVISRVSGHDNLYEIHANISFKEHWLFDVLGPENRAPCNLPCCSIFENAVDMEEVEAPEVILQFEDVLPIAAEGETQTVTIDVENIVEGTNTNVEGRLPNVFGLKRVKAFLEIIKSRIELIFSDSDDSFDNLRRRFNVTSVKYYFSQSTATGAAGNAQQTPIARRVREETSLPDPTSPTPAQRARVLQQASFEISKSSTFELEIYTKCSIYFPSFFPRIYDIVERAAGGQIIYTFELMSPLVNSQGCSVLLFGGSPFDNLVQNVKFALDCLFELHILHSVIGIIHCDISPVNIMFSTVDNIWKIFDFNLSVSVSQSKVDFSRRVGTKNFIAPECSSSGKYSEASDVFSLGSVIFDLLYPILYRNFEEHDEYYESFIDYEYIVVGMIEVSLSRRISVREALIGLFFLLKRILPSEHYILKDQVFRSVKLYLETNFNLNIPKISETAPPVESSEEVPFSSKLASVFKLK